ncbi:MAG: aquaporin-like protein [Benniella sp.]|nr:MAG: aquaporin-like protein [Benniella sp.]
MDNRDTTTTKSSSAKGWLIQSLAEFIGTAMFLYLAIGGADAVTQSVGMGPNILGTAFAFGMALTVVAWAFFRISGAHFNPAISFSSLITGHISFPKFVLYFIAQLLGAMVGVALARGTTPSSAPIVGQVNTLMYGESIARGFFLEFFLTAILCFVYHMTVHEKNRSTFLAALPYGLTLFSCHLFATRYTNAAINPARAFGTSVAARSFAREHWIYWFGPLCGAILAAALHILFRYMDYDHYSAGIDAKNHAQYTRAQAAYRDGVPVHHDGVNHPTTAGGVHHHNGTTTAAGTGGVLPR